MRLCGVTFPVTLCLVVFGGPCPFHQVAHAQEPSAAASDEESTPEAESRLLANPRQLTFAGRRAGEGYFSRDGKSLVFQSERDPENPFFQIFLLDLDTGDLERISPGHGKTTCAWIHPQGGRVLFASTHEDPQAVEKQREELQVRAAGKERRYSWDYDEHFDLFEFDRDTREFRNLTNTTGYDAEASWSPDGEQIVFASNRRAYSEPMTEREQAQFEIDPASMIDLYIMRADGSDVRRLTESAGYDGGPFFSPDGRRICWRRFSEDGARAEIFTANSDGTDPRQLTSLGAMSWAPYYHPSGEYLIFTTNRHGFANFELYLVDVDGNHEPVRVTFTDGFDGLPVFTPDGKQLAWTTNRTPNKQSQIFIANWNHERARGLLGLDRARESPGEVAAAESAASEAASVASSRAAIDCDPDDILRHVDYFCRPELAGRLTGTPGERLATAYVAAYMDHLGLEPAGDDGTFFQEFDFTAGARLGVRNTLAANGVAYRVDEDWRPLAFSATGSFEAAPVVFCGYGIVAPAQDGQEEYDSYVHLDVTNKWVVVFRYMPENIPAERRQHLSGFSGLRYKAMAARDRGARGLIVVSGPNSQVKEQLVPMQFDGALAGTSIPVICVRDDVAGNWLSRANEDLKAVQDRLDAGELVMGFPLGETQVQASVDIETVKQKGRNVLGRLRSPDDAGNQDAAERQVVIVGAHVDHLGQGGSANSLAKGDERTKIHFGADDNASGVAAMLEVAEYLSAQRKAGRLPGRRDILFAAWSGEELGLIGSTQFLKAWEEHRSSNESGEAASSHEPDHSLHSSIAACLNMDMVGRLRDKLILQGVGSSTMWRSEIEQRNAPLGLPLSLQDDSYLPTDASAFFMRGIPILSAFTGSHDQYHTPSDTPETLNYEGAARVAKLMALVARSLANRDEPPDYVPQTAPNEGARRARLRAYLGTIPDYAEGDVKGVALSGVAEGGPASQAGLEGGDVIVELAGRKIENIYDYTYAIEALKIGQTVTIKVLRDKETLSFEVTPGSRE